MISKKMFLGVCLIVLTITSCKFDDDDDDDDDQTSNQPPEKSLL